MSLNSHIEELRAGGVEVMGITAEPGGDEAVLSRLEERGAKVDFPIKSDPQHELLVKEDIYVIEDKEWEVSGPYKMVQPALVVLDGDDVIKECMWSWKTMGYGDGSAMDRVPLEKPDGTTVKVLLVTLRPDMSDLLNSIQERRAVKLTSTHAEW